MSTLVINELRGLDASGSIAVTAEGGSTTTNLQNGLVKHWVNYDSVNQTTDGSFNQTSLTDVAEGTFTSNYTNYLSGASNKCILSNSWNTRNDGVSNNSGASRGGSMSSQGAVVNSTSSINFQTFYGSTASSNGALEDMSGSYCTTLGDLA